MTLLTNWPTVWLMTGMGIGIVFCILIILVLILQFMGDINARTIGSKKAQAAADGCPCGCGDTEASEADLAAVATAVHLYQNDLHDYESGVLTWHPTETAWHSELNPSL